MVIDSINWPRLKKNIKWRGILREKTLDALTVSNKVELSQYNGLGYFHKVPNTEDFERMRLQWENTKRVPQEWISKGHFPGIWLAMFSPHNTYSVISCTSPILIARFYFKEGYYVFDRENLSHNKIFQKWLERNVVIDNPWDILANSYVESLRDRMELHGYPPFKKFFEDNHFGALIGYSDYIATVIILEESIDRVEFSTIK